MIIIYILITNQFNANERTPNLYGNYGIVLLLSSRKKNIFKIKKYIFKIRSHLTGQSRAQPIQGWNCARLKKTGKKNLI
jgi:hypothetical protein